MKNVTITLDEETANWARIYAASQQVSLSKFIGNLLRRTMHESREYEDAMTHWLSRPASRLNAGIQGQRGTYPGRDELYEDRSPRG